MLKLLEKFDDEADADSTALSALARVMRAEFMRRAKKQDDGFYSSVWSSLAPNGNIYRLVGINAEMRKHALDLQGQLAQLADKYKNLLGGNGMHAKQRSDNLRDALLTTPMQGKVNIEEGLPGKTHPALDEFCSEGVHTFGPLVIPDDVDEKKSWLQRRAVALIIFVVQLLAPICVCIHRVHDQRDVLSASYLYKNLNWNEFVCLGKNLDESLVTMTGFPLLYLVIFVVQSYANDELEQSRKSCLCPQDNIWRIMSVIANATACVLIVLALPFLFLSEDTPTQLLLDAMGLLFLLSVDDLGTDVCAFIGMDNSDFQRGVSWSAILLSQCPVYLGELINPNAKSLEDLWCVRVDPDKGFLLTTTGDKCQTRLESFSTGLQNPEVSCQLGFTDERTPLTQGKTQANASNALTASVNSEEFVYRRSSTHCHLLPSRLDKVLNCVWYTVSWLVTISVLILPPVWLVLSKPCYA